MAGGKSKTARLRRPVFDLPSARIERAPQPSEGCVLSIGLRGHKIFGIHPDVKSGLRPPRASELDYEGIKFKSLFSVFDTAYIQDC